jgi:DNA-binding transcriptional regulator YhcF (GntR family)
VAREAIENAVREAKALGLDADEVRAIAATAIDRWMEKDR